MRVSAVLLASAAVVAVASATCLNLPTIDTVSLPHYLGNWCVCSGMGCCLVEGGTGRGEVVAV